MGSYPVLYKGVFVSLIGRDLDSGQKGRLWLADVAREVEQEIGGRISSEEEVVAQKKESDALEASRVDSNGALKTKL